MLFRAVTSIAVLAVAATAAAEPAAYRPNLASIPRMSLLRRDDNNNGYQPEEAHCHEGNTCAEACGAEYIECAASNKDKDSHCFNPAAQNCCADGSGNACDKGYYCSHDTKKQTWCCRDDLSLEDCAKHFGVKGGLETAVSTTASSTSTTSTTSSSTSSSSSTVPTTSSTTSIKTTSQASSSGCTTAWTGANSTITSATLTKHTSVFVPSSPMTTVAQVTSEAPATVTDETGGANSMGASALLIAVAGVFALF